MSYWYEPKKKDISISTDGEEVDIYLGQDDNGSIYATVKITDLLELLDTHFIVGKDKMK